MLPVAPRGLSPEGQGRLTVIGVGYDGTPEIESLRQAAQREASAAGAEFTVEVGSGAPVAELIALSGEVDLLVIGSRRWGPAVRVLLGSTGEELMHDARCSIMVVPRPAESADGRSELDRHERRSVDSAPVSARE